MKWTTSEGLTFQTPPLEVFNKCVDDHLAGESCVRECLNQIIWKRSPNLKVLRNFDKYLKNYFKLFWHEIGGRAFVGGNMYAYVFILLSLKIVALFYLFFRQFTGNKYGNLLKR